MRRNKPLSISIFCLGMLAIFVSACSFPSSSLPKDAVAGATQTAFALAFAQLATPTLIPPATTTPTPTLSPDSVFETAIAQAVPATQMPSANPHSYTLQQGEYPYCIARRFNVDPKELLAINNYPGPVYASGLVLSIPQSGKPFPASRMLNLHPVTYTVPAYQTTIYRVACYFGDVDPLVLMQYNNLTSPILTAGQVLQIP